MATNIEQDAWTETFLITVWPKGEAITAARDFRAIVSTYDISGGDKDFTSIANAKGGRIKNFAVQTDYEITMEGYAVQAGGKDATVNAQGFFDLQHSSGFDVAAATATTQPMSIAVDHSRTEFLLAIEHTDNISATSAAVATEDGDRALRDVFKNGHFTSVNQSFTDGINKFSIKFKSAPFDKAASANVTFESTDGTTLKPLPLLTNA